MNSITRSIASQFSLSTPALRKSIIAALQQSSLYYYYFYSTSTTTPRSTSARSSTTRLKNQQQQQQQKHNEEEPETREPKQKLSDFPPTGRPKSKDLPKPSEIPWQAKVANLVNLIGRVKTPVQFKGTQDGKYWAGTTLACQSSDSSSSFSIPVVFEGDLAHVAACHLKEKNQIYVAGGFSVDPLPFSLTEGRQGDTQAHVLVHSLNIVRGFAEVKKRSVKSKQEEWDIGDKGKCLSSGKNDTYANHPLDEVIVKSQEWWDIRSEKDDSRPGAAFEHKENGQLVGIDESTPEWILKKLEGLTFDRKNEQKSRKITSLTKEGDGTLSPWRDLIRNPKQWWDFREQKLSGSVKAKHPDFKHKDSGTALWLDSAPTWVYPGLDGLEFDVRIKQVKNHKKDGFWRDLVENPDKWWDNRSKKTNEKAPDFKHKDSGEVLWLNDSPDWVPSKLPPLKA